MLIDVQKLRAAFEEAKRIAREEAVWDPSDAALPPETCPYCGQYRQRWAGCAFDGHVACIVTNDFKRYVGELLQSSPQITTAGVAKVLGVTAGTIQSWWHSYKGNEGVLIPVKRERTGAKKDVR